jgi:hypothetical protein
VPARRHVEFGRIPVMGGLLTSSVSARLQSRLWGTTWQSSRNGRTESVGTVQMDGLHV